MADVYFILAFFAPIIGITLYCAYRGGRPYYSTLPFDWGNAFFVAFFSGVVATGALLGVHLAIASIFFSTTTTVNVDIRSVGAGSQTEGSFFLGSGSVNEESVFYYYREDNGVLALRHRLTDKTSIVEDAPDRPYMSCQVTKYTGLYSSDDSPRIRKRDNCTFHVPPNSVVRSYNLETP